MYNKCALSCVPYIFFLEDSQALQKGDRGIEELRGKGEFSRLLGEIEVQSGPMVDTTLHQPGLVYEKVRAGHWEIQRKEIQIMNKVGKRRTARRPMIRAWWNTWASTLLTSTLLHGLVSLEAGFAWMGKSLSEQAFLVTLLWVGIRMKFAGL
jgi:hypothetical protein